MSYAQAFEIEKLKTSFDNIITLKREISKVKKSGNGKTKRIKGGI